MLDVVHRPGKAASGTWADTLPGSDSDSPAWSHGVGRRPSRLRAIAPPTRKAALLPHGEKLLVDLVTGRSESFPNATSSPCL